MHPDSDHPGLFRKEAFQHYLREVSGKGVLRVSPPWAWTLLWLLGLMVVAGVLFSVFGKVEVNEKGRGILRPVAGVRLLVSPGQAVISEVFSSNGALLRQRAPILRMEAPNLKASLLESEAQLRLLQSDFALVARDQDQLFERQKRDLQAKLRSREEEVRSREHSIALQQRKMASVRKLFQEGIVGAMEVDNADEQLEQAKRQDRAAKLDLIQAQQDLKSLEAQRKTQLFTRASDLQTAQARRQGLGFSLSQHLLEAPGTGYLDGLLARPGDLVQAGQILARLVPEDAELQVVAFLSEKHRGFVAAGDEVKIELTQYPFTEFGTLRGRITRVGLDLATAMEWREAMGEEHKEEGATFRVEIEVSPEREGRMQRVVLRPGMLASVRFTLRRQSLITFVLDPLRRWLE